MCVRLLVPYHTVFTFFKAKTTYLQVSVLKEIRSRSACFLRSRVHHDVIMRAERKYSVTVHEGLHEKNITSCLFFTRSYKEIYKKSKLKIREKNPTHNSRKFHRK